MQIDAPHLLILQKPSLLCLRDYEAQKRAGVEQVFDPRKLSIRNADRWSTWCGAQAPAQPAAEPRRPPRAERGT